MSSLSSTSTIAQAIAVYQDNAGYREDNSITEAAAFVTACRWLLLNFPKLARSAAGSEVQFDQAQLKEQIKDAEQFIVLANQAQGDGVRFYSTRDFRS